MKTRLTTRCRVARNGWRHTCLLPVLALPVTGWMASADTPSSVLYVSRHFEVRADDQPVKYLFNGDTRVARITGLLNGSQRLQRLRLQPGWNLCSLAVGQTRLPAHGAIDRVYRWEPAGNLYVPVDAPESLDAGAVLWIRASAPAVISFAGTPPVSGPATVPPDGALAGNRALESIALNLPAGVTVWKFDATGQRWQAALDGDLAGINELPPKLAPGEAIYLHASEPVQLSAVDPAKRVTYYHPDHLGSSSVVSDAEGAVLRETSHHPFGAVRNDERWADGESHYGYTGKEHDPESALDHFEARYLWTGAARFLTVDPMNSADGRNAYAYGMNNPVRFMDPTGLQPRGTANAELTVNANSDDVTASAGVSGSHSTEGVSTASWLEPIQTRYRTSFSGRLGAETSLSDIGKGNYLRLEGSMEGKFSYDTEALWTLHVPFKVSARGGVDGDGLSYEGTASARYRLGANLPSLGAISVSFTGRGASCSAPRSRLHHHADAVEPGRGIVRPLRPPVSILAGGTGGGHGDRSQ